MRIHLLPILLIGCMAISSSWGVEPVQARVARSGSAESGPSAEIESLRRAVQADGLDDAQREEALSQLDAAIEEDRSAARFAEQAAAVRDEIAERPSSGTRPAAERVGDAELALQEWVARIRSDADVETLEGLLEAQQVVSGELASEIDEAEAELARILANPAASAVQIAALRAQVDELSPSGGSDDGIPSLVADARRMRRDAAIRRLEAEMALRRAEQETSLERQRRRELALREMRASQRRNAKRVEWLQHRIAERGREELELQVERLTRVEAPGPRDAELGAALASENALLGEELLAQNDRLAADRELLSKRIPARDRIATALQDSRRRLELGGTNEAVGRWLWSERRRLEPTARLRRAFEKDREELAELRLQLVTQSETERELSDLSGAARNLLEARYGENEGDEAIEARAEATVVPYLRRRAELLTLLEPIRVRRLRTLEQSEAVLQEQIELTQSLRQLLDRYLLWTPSHGSIDASWFERVPEGVLDLTKPARWATTARLVRETIAARPIVWTAALIALLVLVDLRRRAPARIRALAVPARQVETDHIGVTLQTCLWTLIGALPGPAVLFLVALLLQSAGSPGRYSDSLGRACAMLVAPLLAVQMLRWAIVEEGLAHVHFRWVRERRLALRSALPRAAAIVLPTCFVTALAFIRNLDLPNDVQARTAIVIAAVVLAWTCWQLLDVGRAWEVRGVEVEPSELRKLLRVGLPLAHLTVAALAVAGYVYTAGLLLQAWLASVSVVVAVAIGVGLIGRWFLVGERRLALRRLAEQPASARPATDEGSGEPTAPEITLEQVSAQTRSMLRALRVGLLAVGFVWVWAEALPAITRLDAYSLWTFHEVGGDGSSVARSVSLMAALFAVVAFALTWVSARNLPGLVELGLSSQTSIDAASRYAITSLLRYAIVIAGTLTGLELLGMRWSQLQWMAAALTVGLGFGLQEIFANFVSGLILLFERPFRVGDVITVGDLTGRVTRIRTRATTILDFDNRETFVPNKSFITGQLLNWTLTDTTTRVTIKLGVADGAAPDLVLRTLLEAANANPLVLREPAPRSWFMAYGASGFDYELRVFVGNLADRLQVQSELHREIGRLFAERGIELGAPQLDLHVRAWPRANGPDGPAVGGGSRSGSGPAGQR